MEEGLNISLEEILFLVDINLQIKDENHMVWMKKKLSHWWSLNSNFLRTNFGGRG